MTKTYHSAFSWMKWKGLLSFKKLLGRARYKEMKIKKNKQILETEIVKVLMSTFPKQITRNHYTIGYYLLAAF